MVLKNIRYVTNVTLIFFKLQEKRMHTRLKQFAALLLSFARFIISTILSFTFCASSDKPSIIISFSVSSISTEFSDSNFFISVIYNNQFAQTITKYFLSWNSERQAVCRESTGRQTSRFGPGRQADRQAGRQVLTYVHKHVRTHTHTHTHIYIYIYKVIMIKLNT